mgnify:CR=1 FL=1
MEGLGGPGKAKKVLYERLWTFKGFCSIKALKGLVKAVKGLNKAIKGLNEAFKGRIKALTGLIEGLQVWLLYPSDVH